LLAVIVMPDDMDRYFLSAAVQLCHQEILFADTLADGFVLAAKNPETILFVDAELTDMADLDDQEIANGSKSGKFRVPLIGVVSGNDVSRVQGRLIERASALLLRPLRIEMLVEMINNLSAQNDQDDDPRPSE